jgi:CHAT domain-containing protein/Tfp pilus assembly protein PilF
MIPKVKLLAPLVVPLGLFLVGVLHVRAGASVWQPPTPAVQAATAAPERSTGLYPGTPIRRSLAGGETHFYEFKLQQGQCAAIQVEQRGINVVLRLLGSGKEPLIEVDEEIGNQGTEKLDIVADSDGTYVVAIRPKLPHVAGSYEIRLTEIRVATASDHGLYQVRLLTTTAKQWIADDKRLEAVPLMERALALAQQQLSADDVHTALVMKDLAPLYEQTGKRAQAQSALEQALKSLTATLGPDHPQTLSTKARLGYLFVDMQDYSKADLLLNQALASQERVLGTDDPALVTTLYFLANLHMDRGDYARAEPELLRARAIQESTGLTEEFEYSVVLNDLGMLYLRRERFSEATAYLERALAWKEKKYGPESTSLTTTLTNLGVAAKEKGDYDGAEKYYLRVLDIKAKYSGPDDPNRVATLINLSNVYSAKGHYHEALEAEFHALRILESTASKPSWHRGLLGGIANNYAALGDFDHANQYESRLQSEMEEDVSLNLAIGSEREKLAYLDNRFISDWTNDPISLSLQWEPGNAEMTALAATVVLQRKGRVLDAMADSVAALRRHSDPEDQALLDHLKEATAQLARTTLQGPQKQSLDDYRKILQQLREKKEQLENTIGHRNEAFRTQLQPVTLGAVLAAIPADSALVEYVTYRTFNPKAQSDSSMYGDLRYAAFVLHRDRPPQGIDLGDAKAVDALIGGFREALRDPGRNDIRSLAQQLARKVFQPLQPLLSSDKRLLVSPDGQLDLIPFEALVDQNSRYLVESFAIAYLSTGRDLLRMQVPYASRSAFVVIANPLFGEPSGTVAARASIKPGDVRKARRSVTTGPEFSSLYFAPLEGTRVEARNIQALFPEARVLAQHQASESALEQLVAPRILHIATHGFFLQDTKHQENSGDDASNVNPQNPLLRSGLALAGANLARDEKGDGILTALEATNLDLWGTKLVTLSACDTGIGEVKNGEGVYGLRRAFFLAGAETLVMSLWQVSDYVTREIMTDYYSGLKRGLGRGDALRQAQLAMLKRKDRSHPFYWASFIQSGEWANLDGQR